MDELSDDFCYHAILCESCKRPLPEDWDYLLCNECTHCRHGNEPSECEECYYQSDFEYDAKRSWTHE